MASTLRLDVVEHLARVGVEQQLDGDDAHALGGDRGDLLDAVQSLDRLLDPDADALLDLFRRGAEVDHADGDDVQGELGEDLLGDLSRRTERSAPPPTISDHQQVGGDAVLGEPGDRPVHHDACLSLRRRHRRGPACRRSPPPGRTRRPAPRRAGRRRRSPCPAVERRISTSRNRSRSSSSTTSTRPSARTAERGMTATFSTVPADDLRLDEQARPPAAAGRGPVAPAVGILDPRHGVDHPAARVDLALGAHQPALPLVGLRRRNRRAASPRGRVVGHLARGRPAAGR